jgi:transposase
MIEAMIYIMRTGCPWRDLPSCFGPWQSVYTRFRRWSQTGLWSAILDGLAQRAKGKGRLIDSTHIKVHQDGANPEGGQQNQAIGRTKGGLNCKVTALVDGRGRVLQLGLSPGNAADLNAAKEIVLPAQVYLVADKGYDSDEFRQEIREKGSEPCIPSRRNRRHPATYSKCRYATRHHVENFFQRVKRFRRIGTRYEKLDQTFLCMLTVAAVLDWLKYGF